MFVLRSRVTLEDASDALMGIGASGTKMIDHLGDIAGNLPEKVDESIESQGYTIIRVAGVNPRFEIYGLLEPMKKLWQALDVHERWSAYVHPVRRRGTVARDVAPDLAAR